MIVPLRLVKFRYGITNADPSITELIVEVLITVVYTRLFIDVAMTGDS